MRRLLHFHLKRAQERMIQLANKKRSDRSFEIRDWVYLRLQPYRQHSLRKLKNHKLSPKYFGPFLVEAKVGSVAYKLTLPPGLRIHPTFQVSQLKSYIDKTPHSPMLPVVGTDGTLDKEPSRILERRMVKKGNRATIKVLVEWFNTYLEDST